jgi:hypothetical protein
VLSRMKSNGVRLCFFSGGGGLLFSWAVVDPLGASSRDAAKS